MTKEPKTDQGRWLVIVNPHAGTNKCEKDWPKIHKLLQEAGFDMQVVTTERKFHAMEITVEMVERHGYAKIIVVGGDGTLNEVVNGLFRQKRIKPQEVYLGMITVGTGNDWARMYEMPVSYKKQVKILQKGYTFLQDVGQVEYLYSKDQEKRYFINIAGMGYDALVAQKTNTMKQKGKGGPIAYLVNLISGLFQYKSVHLNIDADGINVFSGKVFSMSIGICKYNGAGMMQLPNAIPDDGLFDMVIIRKTTKYRIVTNIKNLYDGSFITMPEVSYFNGKTFKVEARPENKLYLETDGESLGHSPLYFEIIPRAITLIVRKRITKRATPSR
ncbi:MAG: diacylglycerol kinase family lipid kinase [bacterium]|jgi:diacylglycerol kinase (ATP)